MAAHRYWLTWGLIATSAVWVSILVALVAVADASRPDHAPRLARRDLNVIDGPQALEQIVRVLDPKPYIDHRQKDSLLARILIPRVPGSPGNAKVREALLTPFKKPGSNWVIDEHKFTASTPEGDKQMTNLIVTLNPTAPHKLVLAAHHDSKTSPKGFVGATDSAVPCAIIVDTALAIEKLLAQDAAYQGNTALQLILFDGEEAYHQWTDTDSVYGSRALAAMWAKTYLTPFQPSNGNDATKRRVTPGYTTMRTIDSIDHFLLLDLLGAAHPRIPSYFPSTNWMVDELSEIERRLARRGLLFPKDDTGRLELPPSGGPKTETLPSPQGASSGSVSNKPQSFFTKDKSVFGIGDDHEPFLNNGVPILHLIPSPFPRVWHTRGDDASAIDWPTTHAWAMLMRCFVAEYMGVSTAETGSRKQRKRDTGEMASSSTLDHKELVSRDKSMLHAERKLRNKDRDSQLSCSPSCVLPMPLLAVTSL